MFFEDKILPNSFIDELEQVMLANTTPWYFQSSTTEKKWGYNKIKGEVDSSQFTHLILWPNQSQSFLWPIVRPVLFFIEKELDLNVISVHRSKANLLHPKPHMNKENFHPPHHDGYEENKKILSALYYVHDSDGDTHFFDKFYPDTPEEMNIVKKVSPERGKIVVFDAHQYHSSSPPRDNERRVVLNFVFELGEDK
jgi:hypothetical protein